MQEAMKAVAAVLISDASILMTKRTESHLTAARESLVELVRYVRESRVQEIYSCWFDDEAQPTVHQRTITPEVLASPDFVFQQQELLRINDGEKQ